MNRLTLIACLLFPALSTSAASLVLHVTTNGNDNASGVLAQRAGDGPLATVGAALRKGRAARPTNDVTIFLHGGVHRLAEPIVFTPQDSGASAGRPLTVAAWAKEKPILSGGLPLSNWKPVAGQPGLWQVDARAELGGNWQFRSLFINGKRATRARTPNAGEFFQMDGRRLNDKPFQFKFRPGNIKPSWADAGNVEVNAFELWTNIRQFIRDVNLASNVVTLSGSSYPHTRENGARYFIENAPDAIDVPGEWRLDRNTGVVTAMFKVGENPNSMELVVPRLQGLVRFQGDIAGRKAVRHIVLRGLTFADTDWSIPAEGYHDSQAAVGVRGEVFGEGMTDCVIDNCTFTRLAGYGVELGRGCQRNRMVGNEMFDLGAGGFRVGETDVRTNEFDFSHSNAITDNHLHHLGVLYPPANGVLILQSGTNRVAHNHIHHLFCTGISVGWTWSYYESPCRANVIEFNHVHDIGQGLLSDMGGVYTLGRQPGTVVRNNLIHDVNAFAYGGWGLYTDEGSSDIVLENNIVYRCKSAGFHQHYGMQNVVRNNIFAFNMEAQLMRTRDEPHPSFYFTNNLVLFNSGFLLGNNWKNDYYGMDYNLYWDTRWTGKTPSPTFSGATFEQWKARGHDKHSILADPLFVAAEQGDFRLHTNSPAAKIGFKPFDLSNVGVRPAERRN